MKKFLILFYFYEIYLSILNNNFNKIEMII